MSRRRPVAIVRDEAAGEAAVASVLRRCPDAPAFARPEYHRCLAAMTGGRLVRAVAGPADASEGVITWLEGGPPDGRVLNALPWFGSHGSPSVAADLPDAAADAVAASLAGARGEAAGEPGVRSACLVLGLGETAERRRAIEAAFGAEVADERIAQRTPLPKVADGGGDADAVGRTLLEEVFGQKTRNLVRKGLRESLRIAVQDDAEAWDRLHELHAAGMRAIGGPVKPPEHLAALRRLPEAHRELWTATDPDDGRIVAAVLLLRWGGTVEYLVPAVAAEARPRQPISAIVHHAMVAATLRGDRWWNWGGTGRTQRSLHHFKAGFGAVDVPYAVLCRCGPGGLEPLRSRGPAGLAADAPWFYAWPYDRLETRRQAPQEAMG